MSRAEGKGSLFRFFSSNVQREGLGASRKTVGHKEGNMLVTEIGIVSPDYVPGLRKTVGHKEGNMLVTEIGIMSPD